MVTNCYVEVYDGNGAVIDKLYCDNPRLCLAALGRQSVRLGWFGYSHAICKLRHEGETLTQWQLDIT